MKPQRFGVFLALFASVMALGLAACAVTRNWQYPPDPPGTLLNVKGSKTLPVTVAVLPLRELRGANVERGSWRVGPPLGPHAVDSFGRPGTRHDSGGGTLVHLDTLRDFAFA